ncbi:hypothetical protein, partial [Scandinavium lactucae]
PSGYEPDELPGCSIPRPWKRTIRWSRFDATLFCINIKEWLKTNRIDYFLSGMGRVARYHISIPLAVCYLHPAFS